MKDGAEQGRRLGDGDVNVGREERKSCTHTHTHTQKHGDAGENLFIVMSFLFLIGQL